LKGLKRGQEEHPRRAKEEKVFRDQHEGAEERVPSKEGKL